MHYDFDREIDRRSTNSLKYDFAVERGKPADVLPLWVADMDFRAPDCVIDAIKKSAEHGIFGYSEVKSQYFSTLDKWFSTRFNWHPQEHWLVKTPGVVYALAMAVRAFTDKGDGVIIQPPVYYPFYSVITDNDRRVIKNELIYSQGRYCIDFDDFEKKITENNVNLFLLCSPHNPVGRVWTPEELQKLGNICKEHGVIVVSDEIHCDFAFDNHPHTIFANANPSLIDQSVICTAPSKTFNLAGLQISNIWIPSDKLRSAFIKEIDRTGYSQLNCIGLAACQAAYENGGEWLEQCRLYIQRNFNFLRDYLHGSIPEIKLVEPDGTYFAWLDCSALKLSTRQLDELVINKAKLWLDAGRIFGSGAGQFQRIVLACTQKTLSKALNQLNQAVDELRLK